MKKSSMTARPSPSPEVSSASRYLWLDWLLLAALSISLVVSVPGWVNEYLLSCEGDPAHHIYGILTVQEGLLGQGSWLQKLTPILLWSDCKGYPPVYCVVLGTLSALMGRLSLPELASCQVLWQIIAIVASYTLCVNLFSPHPGSHNTSRRRAGRWAGCLSAAVIAYSPQLISHVTTFFIDLAGTAMLLVALSALARAKDMRSPWTALWAGIATGLALLTKWTEAVFLLPPLLAITYYNVKKRRFKEILLFSADCLLLAGCLYLSWAFICSRVRHTVEPMLHRIDPHVALYGLGLLLLSLIISWIFTCKVLRSPRLRHLMFMIQGILLCAGPFYFLNLQDFLLRFQINNTDRQMAESAYWLNAQNILYPNFVSPSHCLAYVFVFAGAIWLLFKGPRYSFAFTFLPVACGMLFAEVFSIAETLRPRHILPTIAMQIITVSGWCQCAKPSRLLGILALGAFAIWQGVVFFQGTPPLEEGHSPTLDNLGTGEFSYYHKANVIVKELSGITGPGPLPVWIVENVDRISPDTFQLASVFQSKQLVFRSFTAHRAPRHAEEPAEIDIGDLLRIPCAPGQGDADTSLLNMLCLRQPQFNGRYWRDMAEKHISNFPRGYVVFIGNSAITCRNPELRLHVREYTDTEFTPIATLPVRLFITEGLEPVKSPDRRPRR